MTSVQSCVSHLLVYVYICDTGEPSSLRFKRKPTTGYVSKVTNTCTFTTLQTNLIICSSILIMRLLHVRFIFIYSVGGFAKHIGCAHTSEGVTGTELMPVLTLVQDRAVSTQANRGYSSPAPSLRL